ncbi:MAG: xylulokinase [Spirochaetia bacterium]|jgi:xylulokinase
MNSLLGIDLGTTSLKASLFLEDGSLLAFESRGYPIVAPKSGYAEQDPEEWVKALSQACASFKEAHPLEFGRMAGIGICGQMHTQAYLDREGFVLRPAITWMDQRSCGLVNDINCDEKAHDLIFQESQNFATTTYTALQALWVKREQETLWEKVRHILVAKDFLKYRLTGKMATDPTDASGTLLYNVKDCAWSDALLRYFGFSPSLLPEVLPSATIIGTITREASRITGLPEGIPVANGCSDNSASALGAGMVEPGQVTLISGTAGVITVCSDRPLPDLKHRTLCWNYCLPDRWVTLGLMQTAGESLNWFRRAFDAPAGGECGPTGDVFEHYDELVKNVPEACGGLVFLPYLNGERTPHWDPFARGLFFGMSLSTDKSYFVRAVMEGVCMGFRQNIETVESLGIKVDQVRAVGGGLRSPVWLSILARIVRKPIVTVSAPDTANLGNILLCGKAIGLFPSVEETAKRVSTTGTRLHFPEGSPAYEKQYSIYRELYEKLKGSYRKCFEDEAQAR